MQSGMVVAAGVPWASWVPAIVALVGVAVTFVFGQRWTRTAWKEERDERQKDREHQAKLDRHRFYRAERIAAYRTLIPACGDMLVESALRLSRSLDIDPSPGLNKTAAWTTALAEVQLIGARQVVEIAQSIERERTKRGLEFWILLLGEKAPPREESWGVQDPVVAENEAHLKALVEACRADIEALGE